MNPAEAPTVPTDDLLLDDPLVEAALARGGERPASQPVPDRAEAPPRPHAARPFELGGAGTPRPARRRRARWAALAALGIVAVLVASAMPGRREAQTPRVQPIARPAPAPPSAPVAPRQSASPARERVHRPRTARRPRRIPARSFERRARRPKPRHRVKRRRPTTAVASAPIASPTAVVRAPAPAPWVSRGAIEFGFELR